MPEEAGALRSGFFIAQLATTEPAAGLLVAKSADPQEDRNARALSLPDPPPNPYRLNARRPGYSASAPSASSIRSSWLYFATRSVRDGAPVLICPHPVATARSAIVTSSVSPERWDITAVYPSSRAIRIAASVSVSVPIWLTLIRIEFATPLSIPAPQPLGVGHEQVVADELHPGAEADR